MQRTEKIRGTTSIYPLSHGREPHRVQTYPIAVTGESVAAYRAEPFGAQLAECIRLSLPYCLAPPGSSLIGNWKTYFFPVKTF